MDVALEKILEPFMSRLTVRSGNGLTRCMNQSLRSYPRIPAIIRRTALSLARVEQTFGFSGVGVRTSHLYWNLVQEYEDYGIDVPVIKKLYPQTLSAAVDQSDDDGVETADHHTAFGTVEFVRERKLPYHEYAAAMAIARRIGLFGGHGRLALDPEIRKRVKRESELVEPDRHERPL